MAEKKEKMREKGGEGKKEIKKERGRGMGLGV